MLFSSSSFAALVCKKIIVKNLNLTLHDDRDQMTALSLERQSARISKN